MAATAASETPAPSAAIVVWTWCSSLLSRRASSRPPAQFSSRSRRTMRQERSACRRSSTASATCHRRRFMSPSWSKMETRSSTFGRTSAANIGFPHTECCVFSAHTRAARFPVCLSWGQCQTASHCNGGMGQRQTAGRFSGGNARTASRFSGGNAETLAAFSGGQDFQLRNPRC
jgi:hypothetical protein